MRIIDKRGNILSAIDLTMDIDAYAVQRGKNILSLLIGNIQFRIFIKE